MTEGSKFHIYACDLACALITPFASRAEAEAHVRFCQDRGDAATMRILDDEELKQIDADDFHQILSPEEDRQYAPPNDTVDDVLNAFGLKREDFDV